MTIGQPHAQQRTLPRAERRERHAAPRAPLSPGPGGGSKASGRPHSPRAHSPRHDGGARATPPRRHFIRLFGRIQTKQCPRPRTDRQGASLVRPPHHRPQVSRSSRAGAVSARSCGGVFVTARQRHFSSSRGLKFQQHPERRGSGRERRHGVQDQDQDQRCGRARTHPT